MGTPGTESEWELSLDGNGNDVGRNLGIKWGLRNVVWGPISLGYGNGRERELGTHFRSPLYFGIVYRLDKILKLLADS